MKQKKPAAPGPFRLFAVIAYDLMLLLSVLLLAGLLAVALNGGEAIGSNNPVFLIYLLAVSLFFYGWFWTHGGQTLGMRAWRVYMLSHGQVGISWKQAFIRFAVAMISLLAFGLGFIWQWISKEKLSWHDLFSGSQLVYYPKKDEQ